MFKYVVKPQHKMLVSIIYAGTFPHETCGNFVAKTKCLCGWKSTDYHFFMYDIELSYKLHLDPTGGLPLAESLLGKWGDKNVETYYMIENNVQLPQA